METLFLWVRLLFIIQRDGDLVLVGKAPYIFFFCKEVETLFLWVRLLLFSKRGGDLVLVGKAPFIFQKRWRPCSCG